MIHDLLSTKYAVRPNTKEPNWKVKNYVEWNKEGKEGQWKGERANHYKQFQLLGGKKNQNTLIFTRNPKVTK